MVFLRKPIEQDLFYLLVRCKKVYFFAYAPIFYIDRCIYISLRYLAVHMVKLFLDSFAFQKLSI